MTSKNSSVKQNQRKVFGRKQSRPLRTERKDALETLLPVLGVSEDMLAKQFHPDKLFPAPFNEYRLEIGFGNGEHLSALLRQYPEIGFMGAEPFINGMAAFLRDIKDDPHDNIRVLMDDALLLVNALTDECLEKIYVLNPDPWPKTRHHKRRIINQENLDEFARTLKPGGELIMATDVDDLAEWMVTECMNHLAFEWTAQNAQDWKTPPGEWIETRYAYKGRSAGRNQSFLIFKKTLAKMP